MNERPTRVPWVTPPRWPDAPPLRQGIDEALRQGGKIIWAHNMYGFEDIPNWLTGRVHANNMYLEMLVGGGIFGGAAFGIVKLYEHYGRTLMQ